MADLLKLKHTLAALSLLALSLTSHAADTASRLDEQVQHLATELRCLVCQNQSIADSQAPLAVQLKAEIRQQLARGASVETVRQFMVQRYGDYVLYKPPVNRTTWALWAGPLLFMIAGGVAAMRYMRTRDLDDEQKKALV